MGAEYLYSEILEIGIIISETTINKIVLWFLVSFRNIFFPGQQHSFRRPGKMVFALPSSPLFKIVSFHFHEFP
jgi:hypothetical protein